MIMATSLLLGACNPATDVNVKETGDKNLIGKSDIRIKDGRMTPEALWAMGRIAVSYTHLTLPTTSRV